MESWTHLFTLTYTPEVSFQAGVGFSMEETHQQQITPTDQERKWFHRYPPCEHEYSQFICYCSLITAASYAT